MDEQEDQAYDQPDYWKGVEDALEEKAHWFRVPREIAGPSTPQLIPLGSEMLRPGVQPLRRLQQP
jgi:hypothetical protein